MNYLKQFAFIFLLLIENLNLSLGQTTCNNGMGRVLYERLPNQQLQGFDDDVIRDTAPPFRVLEKCQDLCLRDRTASNNLVRTCTSFDFQPGSRIASFSGSAEYEESTCYLTREQAAPEGIGNLMLVPNSVHFMEICLTSSRPERECPSRRYAFERHPRKKLKLPISDIKEITAANRSDCEDKCLNEFSFVCRSANFDSTMRTCILSRFTRRTHPELLEDDPNSDYLENTCLNAERRCDGLAVFVKEENKRLGGPFEVDIFNNMTLEECQTMCLRAEKYFCRSVEFDDQTKQCILSEEDSISQKDDISISSSPTHHFYDLVCLDNQRGTDYPDNSVTSHLFSSGRRPDTAFQRYRNSRLGGEFHSEITGRSLSECLDECLRQTSFQCRSAVFSDRFRTCRLSRYNQRDGMRIIYDADYDYYENLMLNVIGSENEPPRPDMGEPNWPAGSKDRYPYPGTDKDKYPTTGDRDRDRDRFGGGGGGAGGSGDRYPPSGERYPPGGERYPPGGERYPPGGERYPPGGERYPPGGERYPPGGDKYPPGEERYPHGGDRYPPSGERYPPGGERYPPSGERYPPSGDRYPPSGDRYPPSGDRYPPGGDRYPPGSDRYPPGSDRYPPEETYPPNDRNKYYGNRDKWSGSDNRHPDDRDRYPNDIDRYPEYERPYDRYPDYGPGDRYPPTGNREHYPEYDTQDGYGDKYGGHRPPPIDDNRLPPGAGLYPISRPFTGDNRDPERDRDLERYGNRFPYDKYSPPTNYRPINDNRIPQGPYPVSRTRPGYSFSDYFNRHYPPDSRYPLPQDDSFDDRAHSFRGYPNNRLPGTDLADKKYPPPYPTRYPLSINPARYPLDPIRHYPGDSPERYSPENSRFGPDIPPYGVRRPVLDPDSPINDRKHPPTSLNRFPVGNDRYPFNIYKYGNGDRFRERPGYQLHYDYDYEDRTILRRPDYDRYDNVHSSRRPGYPTYDSPYQPQGVPDAYNNNGGSQRPQVSRCEEVDNFKQIASRHKMNRQFIKRTITVPSLIQCQRECVEIREFICRSFNYRDTAASTFDERDTPNCELSDRSTRELDVHNPKVFDAANYDFYERSMGRSGGGDCLDVSQTCNEEGMEFTLRTPEGFIGRIYTYGFYDRCFFRGDGATVNVLRITGAQGYPECGTQRYGDTLTNIVVVQYSDNVQTSRDKRYNLTCVFRGPGEAVVTSGYIGAGLYNPDRSGSPIPIEYLPAENTLSSKVRLMILYQNRPTTTIAVGDPLTFRLEAQDGYNHITDIFATNVVARDPYSGRSIQLIDRFGCPVDPYVFPELDKLRDGDTLEARFNAFKIPESNFLVFEATVRSCREGCQPAYCPGPSGRSEPSFGRRKRSINVTETVIPENQINTTISTIDDYTKNITTTTTTIEPIMNTKGNSNDQPEQVREMIEVFESRDDIIEHESIARKLIAPVQTVCMTYTEYNGLIAAVIALMIVLFGISIACGLIYRRYWMKSSKSICSDNILPNFNPSSIRTHERFSEISQMNNAPRNNHLKGNMSLFSGGLQKSFATGNLARICQIPVRNPIRYNNNNNSQFDDPSEPIYTDPSLFERSRSLRSLSEDNGHHQA